MNPSSRAVHHLAVVPEAAQLGDLGVRLLLRPNDHVQNALRVLRDRSRQPAGCPRSRNAESHRLMGGSANGRMLRLGDFLFMTATAVTVPHSIVGWAILVLPRFAHHSGRLEPMP